MKADRGANSKRLTREEAKLALDRVRERYGIHPSEGPERARGNTSPIALDVEAAQQNQSGRPLDFETVVSPHIAADANEPVSSEFTARFAIEEFSTKRPLNDFRAETQQFHYLIRITECVLPLHCQVEAETAAEAVLRVKQIRNLTEWREISPQELAAIIQNDTWDAENRHVHLGYRESKATPSRCLGRRHSCISQANDSLKSSVSDRESTSVLTSWKEIARYVGKSVRAIQRWERVLGFPVRRAKLGTKSIVLAIPSEINAWVQSQQFPHGQLGSAESEQALLLRSLDALRTENQELQRQLVLERTKGGESAAGLQEIF